MCRNIYRITNHMICIADECVLYFWFVHIATVLCNTPVTTSCFASPDTACAVNRILKTATSPVYRQNQVCRIEILPISHHNCVSKSRSPEMFPYFLVLPTLSSA